MRVTDNDNCVTLAYTDGTVIRWQMQRTEVDLLDPIPDYDPDELEGLRTQ